MTDKTTESQKSPNPVDLHVGGRVRMRRRMLGVSQERLAEALGLTFQQVQKYERGANRVSASKLYAIAAALQVPVTYFFAGLPDTETSGDGVDPAREQSIQAFLRTPEGVELASGLPKITRPHLRRVVLDLVRAAAEDDA